MSPVQANFRIFEASLEAQRAKLRRPTAIMLCDQCLDAVRQAEKINKSPVYIQSIPWQSLTHHDTISSFERAVKHKCYICSRLKSKRPISGDQSMNFAQQSVSDFKMEVHAILWGESGPEHLERDDVIDMQFQLQVDRLVTELEFQLIPLPELHRPLPQMLSRWIGSPEVLDQAHTWLNTCRNTHDKCLARKRTITLSAKEGTVPKRFIDICPSDLGDSMWRLHEVGSDGSIKGGYITLSHRWCNPEPLKLTAGSYKSMRKGQHFDNLPQDYQDAVHVAKHLGVRYLWIDSICIMQDSLLDISAEAHRMAVVYSNAVLNIAAMNCPDDSSTPSMRICGEREPLLVDPSSLCLRAKQLDLRRSWHIRDKDIWIDELEGSPLVKRAWILQEQILAMRTLYVGRNQILWLCANGAACESYSTAIPRNSGYRSAFRFIQPAVQEAQEYIQNVLEAAETDLSTRGIDTDKSSTFQPIQSTNDPPRETLDSILSMINSPALRDHRAWEVWDSLIAQYSRRDLTNDNDKLLAIAGITSVFQSHLQDEFLAGLWRRQMPISLLWKVIGGRPTTKGYRAPSWSWASIDGSIEPSKDTSSRDLRRPTGQILDCSIEILTEYSFGGVKEGTSITLEAPAAELYHQNGKGWGLTFVESSGNKTQILDSKGDASHSGYMSVRVWEDWGPGTLQSMTCPLTAAVICTRIHSDTKSYPYFQDHAEVSGLVLKSYAEDSPGKRKYQRVGCFSIHGDTKLLQQRTPEALKLCERSHDDRSLDSVQPLFDFQSLRDRLSCFEII